MKRSHGSSCAVRFTDLSTGRPAFWAFSQEVYAAACLAYRCIVDCRHTRIRIADGSLGYVQLLYPNLIAAGLWACGVCCFSMYRATKKTYRPNRLPRKEYAAHGGKVILFFALLFVNGSALSGYLAPEGAVELSYPLRSGVYYVGGGGGNRWINNHQAFPPQDYALDIVQLNVFGNRARGIRPEELEKYTIYGDWVYSPCSGSVVVAVDGGCRSGSASTGC